MQNVLTREEVHLLETEIGKIFTEHHLTPSEGIQVLLCMAMGSIYHFAKYPKTALMNIAEAMMEEAENFEETEDDE